jgi:predicted nucleic acid-binding protein
LPYLLDTNIAIRLRDGDDRTTEKVAALDGPVLLSVMTRIELEGGVYADPAESSNRRLRVDALLQVLSVLPFDDAAADAYRSIVEIAGFSRRKILDRLIASHALTHQATLVTANPDDFKDVPGLNLLVW